MMDTTNTRRKAIIGNVNHDFWIYDSDSGFDLTHPVSPNAPQIATAITLSTTTSAITIDPRKSALVIIDMQNFFLSSALGRPTQSKGLEAQERLLQHAIPAARKAGIQIAWLNWGLSEQDLETLPPSVHRTFGFSSLSVNDFGMAHGSRPSHTIPERSMNSPQLNKTDLGKDARLYKGLGQPLGKITMADGSVISAGRMLMRQQWNTELSSPLWTSFKSSIELPRPDVWLNKSRMSGLHVPGSPAGLYFQNHGIKTLLFAGVNTDQCVNATLTDAFCQGYDCILLRDGCATTTRPEAQECVENNVAKTMGFVLSCVDFSEGVDMSLS